MLEVPRISSVMKPQVCACARNSWKAEHAIIVSSTHTVSTQAKDAARVIATRLVLSTRPVMTSAGSVTVGLGSRI